MAQEVQTPQEFFAELAAAGEETVRLRVARFQYGKGTDHHYLAEEWLRGLDRERSDATARDAKKAARTANTAAIIAAIAAAIASVAAVIALFQNA